MASVANFTDNLRNNDTKFTFTHKKGTITKPDKRHEEGKSHDRCKVPENS